MPWHKRVHIPGPKPGTQGGGKRVCSKAIVESAAEHIRSTVDMVRQRKFPRKTVGRYLAVDHLPIIKRTRTRISSQGGREGVLTGNGKNNDRNL